MNARQERRLLEGAIALYKADQRYRAALRILRSLRVAVRDEGYTDDERAEYQRATRERREAVRQRRLARDKIHRAVGANRKQTELLTPERRADENPR